MRQRGPRLAGALDLRVERGDLSLDDRPPPVLGPVEHLPEVVEGHPQLPPDLHEGDAAQLLAVVPALAAAAGARRHEPPVLVIAQRRGAQAEADRGLADRDQLA